MREIHPYILKQRRQWLKDFNIKDKKIISKEMSRDYTLSESLGLIKHLAPFLDIDWLWDKFLIVIGYKAIKELVKDKLK